jgi:hypothetical protein
MTTEPTDTDHQRATALWDVINDGHDPQPQTADGHTYWIQCPCGWESRDLPPDYATWITTMRAHRDTQQ